MRRILDSLLEGKSSWPDVQVSGFAERSLLSSPSYDMFPDWSVSLTCAQVTLIPTFDSLAMHEWYQETHDRQRELLITVLGSNSTVAMQEETFPACKVEF